jgi:hypothetical protein
VRLIINFRFGRETATKDGILAKKKPTVTRLSALKSAMRGPWSALFGNLEIIQAAKFP